MAQNMLPLHRMRQGRRLLEQLCDTRQRAHVQDLLQQEARPGRVWLSRGTRQRDPGQGVNPGAMKHWSVFLLDIS